MCVLFTEAATAKNCGVLKGSLHLAKFAIANIVQVLAQVIRKVERSKIHIAQVKKF